MQRPENHHFERLLSHVSCHINKISPRFFHALRFYENVKGYVFKMKK